MEPTIYKPSAYNMPGVYTGAGGIYKGRGVYNDGVDSDFGTIDIQGKTYNWARINGLKVITESLVFFDDNIMFKTNHFTDNPSSWFYDFADDDPNGYGMYFNSGAVNYLSTNQNNLLPDGWRIWTNNDIQQIVAGFTSNDLISEIDGGNNSSKLNLRLSGILGGYNTVFEEVGDMFNSWQYATNYYERGGLYCHKDGTIQVYAGWTSQVGRSLRVVSE